MTDKAKLISIIVPVYNVEKYLANCVDSIISQSYSNIEVILVDDGSQDLSSQICDEYAQKDSRVKVFHRTNMGKGESRKFGFMSSVGDYIMFVDSDDWMAENGVEMLFSSLSDDVDIVIGSSTVFFEHSGVYLPREEILSLIFKEFGKWDKMTHLESIMLNNLPREPWAKLYRRSLFTEDSFPNTKRMQDVLMNIDIACRCRMINFVDKHVYFYRDDSASSTKRTFNRSREFYIQIVETAYDILNRNNMYDSVKNTFASFAFRLYYDARRTHLFDSTEPFVLEIKKNIDPKTLKWRRKMYLKSFDSHVVRSCFKGVDKMFRVIKKRKQIVI